MHLLLPALLLFVKIFPPACTTLDFLACGMDADLKTLEGEVSVRKYSWLGIMYYSYDAFSLDDERATTMAVLIRKQFALVPSFDISNIPKGVLSTHVRVVFGEGWGADAPGQPVEHYILHPEYGRRTVNTFAIIKFLSEVRGDVWPVCPPISGYIQTSHQDLYSVIIEDVKMMTKVVRKMTSVGKEACFEFYRKHKLLFRRMQPIQPICAVATSLRAACVWEAGSALVSRDPWGRWRLIGFGVRGPGCAAPAQYLDVFRYLKWIESTASEEEHISIFRTAPNQLFISPGSRRAEEWETPKEKVQKHTYKPYHVMGNCFDTTVETEEIYREDSLLFSDSLRSVKGTYRMKITQIVNVMCVSVTTKAAHDATPPFLWIEHLCNRTGDMCHIYQNTTSAIELTFLFSFKMRLKVEFMGQQIKNESLDESVQLQPPDEARLTLNATNTSTPAP